MVDEIRRLGIVILGDFHPSTFSPAWFRLHGLIGPTEAEGAEVQIIAPPLASLTIDWLGVNVQEGHFNVFTAIPQEFDRLRDVAVGAIGALTDIPVSAITINSHLHWQVESSAQWHTFGDLLVPKTFWKPLLTLPGTRDVAVEGIRQDGWFGFTRVTVQPDLQVTPNGLYAVVSDHFWLAPAEAYPTSRDEFTEPSFRTPQVLPSSDNIGHLFDILGNRWNDCIERAQLILNRLTSLSREGR